MCDDEEREYRIFHEDGPIVLTEAELLNDYMRLRESSDGLRAKLARAAYVAEHLMQMIDQETWRAQGGDDGQGHYEGDYHEAQIALEVKEWATLAATSEGDD